MNTTPPSIKNNSNTHRPVALVIGASGGIGSSVVASLLSKGWDVIAAARHEDG